jgi:hypothetical protein
MKGREPFGYVVAIEGSKVTLNLKDTYKGQFAAHREGISAVTEINSLFGIDGGNKLLVLRVASLLFLEPKEVHKFTSQKSKHETEPLRQIIASVVGHLKRKSRNLFFTPDSLASPALGSEAFPLNDNELGAIIQPNIEDNKSIVIGTDIRGLDEIKINVADFLSRHAAVLGSTGQGKSCFIAAILQQISKFKHPRVVVFDINGEYEDALKDIKKVKITKIGNSGGYKIPYMALGRHGLSRLLMPSEKTQRPALAFAIDNLDKIKNFQDKEGVGLHDSQAPILFDDCRTGDAKTAWQAIEKLRNSEAPQTDKWPHMAALASLVAESYSLKPNNGGAIRDGFLYSNVSPLITRIKRCIDDPLFTKIIDVTGKDFINKKSTWMAEGKDVVNKIFGDKDSDWDIHVVNLRDVAHDLMPLILGALLELFAFELFNQGQDNTYPTLLVLEEAHHYLRQYIGDDEGGRQNLAYERLAKEGRKFGLSLLMSTQRPSEMSSTVLSQCGTWIVFRLTSDQDLRTISAASEWVDKLELNRIAGLPRQQALIFGSSFAVPIRVQTPIANPRPKSHDPDFNKWF